MELTPFYTIFAPMVGKELAELLQGGGVYSFPVPLRRDGRLYDALFLYHPRGDSGELPPTGWMLIDSFTGKLSLLSDCAVVGFAAPGLTAPKTAAQEKTKDLSPKKEAQLRARLGDLYEELRRFVFEEKLERPQAAVVTAYKELFLKLTPAAHYPLYYALSPEFFHWLRIPLPVPAAKAHDEGEPPHADTTQLLILENLQQLVRRFEQKIQVDAHKQKLFDDMHAELERYRKGVIDSLTLPMERDVIKLIDDVQKSLSVFDGEKNSPENYERMLAMFKGVATDLEDLLYRHGVEPYEERGNDVSVARQQVFATVVTDDPALDKKVAQRLSRGWEKQGKIVRPERISVYLYQQEEDTSDEQNIGD